VRDIILILVYDLYANIGNFVYFFFLFLCIRILGNMLRWIINLRYSNLEVPFTW
jgi:hypothetical protein